MNDQCTALFTHTHILSLSLLPSFSLFPLPHPMARPSLSSLAITPPCVFLTSHLHPVQTIYIKDFSAHTFHHRSHFETLTLPPLSLPLSLRLKTTTTLIHKLFLGGDSSEALRKHEDRKVADQITPT